MINFYEGYLISYRLFDYRSKWKIHKIIQPLIGAFFSTKLGTKVKKNSYKAILINTFDDILYLFLVCEIELSFLYNKMT